MIALEEQELRRAAPHKAPGVVYVAAGNGLCKIGFSRNLARRLASLFSPFTSVAIVHQIRSKRPSWLERYLHIAFRHVQFQGHGRETFRLQPADVELLKSIPECHDIGQLPAAVRDLFRQNGGPVVASHTSCNSWKCRECAGRLRARWKANIKARMVAYSGPSFYCASMLLAQSWRTVLKRLRRSHADYFRFSSDGGTSFTVVSTVPLMKTCPALPASEALAFLLSELDRYSGVKPPLSSSAAWRLSTAESPPISASAPLSP